MDNGMEDGRDLPVNWNEHCDGRGPVVGLVFAMRHCACWMR